MKDFASTLFSQLNNSNEFQTLKNDFNQLKSNIENSQNINQIFAMLGHNKIAHPLRDRVEKILKGYIEELLDGMDMNSLCLYFSYSTCSIHLTHDKIPCFEFQPRHWASPTSNMVYINFAKQQITVYDAKDEYEQADELFRENVQKESKKLQELEDHLALMNKKKKSRAFIMKEIRKRLFFINMPKYILLYIGCYLFPSKYKALLEAMEKMIQKQEKEIKYQQERVQEMEKRSYLLIYEEFHATQQQILKKLEPLHFKIKTETVDSIFNKSDD